MSEKRVAIVTGAAQGIGRRTAEILAERGFALAMNDLAPMPDAAAAVRRRGVDALELVGDITDEATVAGFASAVRDRWGRADVLVNNAGISFIAPAEETSAAGFRRVLEVNLVAPFLLCRAFAPLFFAQGSASVVNVASIAGLT